MLRIALGFGMAVLILGCNQIKGHSFAPVIPGFTTTPQKTILLKKQLREISGIYYHTPTELVAMNDEEAPCFSLIF